MALFAGCAPQQNDLNNYSQIKAENSSNIIGGKLATEKFQQDNGIVGLVIIESTEKGQTQAICTGTLIAPRVIVTAAHCLMRSSATAKQLVVAYFKSDMSAGQREDFIAVDGGAINENYMKGITNDNVHDLNTSWNDIALIHLSKPAPNYMKIAQLAGVNEDISLKAGDKLILSGFGITTPVINEITKDPATGKDVVTPLKSEGSGVLRLVAGVPVTQITPENKEIILKQNATKTLKGACHGDSGGPAFIKSKSGKMIQVGVTSRGTEKLGNCTESVIYTNIQGQLPWLQQKLALLTKAD